MGYVLCSRACKWQRKDGEFVKKSKNERVEERIKSREYQLNKAIVLHRAETKLVAKMKTDINN